MKIAISSSGKDLNATIDPRFGRAKNFIIYDIETDSFEAIDNIQSLSLMKGAGVQSAQNVVSQGVKVVITGHIGPKAYQVLEAAEVDVYLAPEGKTVKDAIEDFKDGKLQKTLWADKPSHW